MSELPYSFITDYGQRALAINALVQMLVDLNEGELLSHDEIESRTGLNIRDEKDRVAISLAIRRALGRHGCIVHNEIARGYRRTRPSEVNGLLMQKMAREHKSLNRLKLLCKVGLSDHYYERMSDGDKRELYRKAAALGAITFREALSGGRKEDKVFARDRRLALPDVAP